MKSPLYLLILAAGQGTRMRTKRAKVLMPLAGRSLIDHVLDTADQLNPDGVCIVRSPNDDVLQSYVSQSYPSVQWAIQTEAHGRGTAAAVSAALPLLPENARVLILYGDVPLLSTHSIQSLLRHPDEELVILTGMIPNPHGYGRIIRNDNNDICAIVEENMCSPEQQRIQEINLGVYYATTDKLRRWLPQIGGHPQHAERYLTDIVAYAIQEGTTVQSTCLPDCTEAIGANTKAQLAQLERYYQQQQADQLLASGVHLYDPQRIDIRGTLSCGQDVSIDINCVFLGHVTLGDGVIIGPHCVICNTTIDPNTHIGAFTHIDGSQIGHDCRIGPYARLRAGTQLQRGVHLGNFVETKQTQIGTHSKAGHLSYLGNCVIGAEVNIGAGTISCNYDGVNKHQTTIEDGAFIGSGSELVAPITIGSGATIAAGTTLTKSAPARSLTVRRSPQKTIKSWSRQRNTPKKTADT